MHKTKHVSAINADLFSGKDRIDREEAMFLEAQAAKPVVHKRTKRVYDRTIGLVF